MAELKTKQNPGSVAAYLDSIEIEQQKADCRELVQMMQSISGKKPMMWGTTMVGFGSYHYRYDSGREGDFFLCGFSPR